jgi:regulator of cell morphogenesis and NO signaling
MSITLERTVRDLALENPAATRVFERLGIDYCCGGAMSLENACRRADLPPDEVLNALRQAQAQTATKKEWQSEPLTSLIAHIQNTHHTYTREEIGRLGVLFEKVCSVHSKNHPELLRVRETFQGLAWELNSHMMKEEMVLFPYIVKMEAAALANEPAPRAPFGSIRNPVAMMEQEHGSAGRALQDMKKTTGGYAAPSDACVSYQTLYKALADFEADLHQHIHLENNILFPRAAAMESAP